MPDTEPFVVPQETPESPQVPDTTPEPAPQPDVAASGQPATPAAPASPSWLAQMRDAGVPIQGDDEKAAIAAFANLYKEHQKVQPLTPYLQAYLANAPEFAKWMESQRQAPPTAQPKKAWHADIWNPPEYDPRWTNMIQRDPATGAVSAAPGVPPDVLVKYQHYEQWRQQHADKLTSPEFPEYIAPIIRKLVQEEASALMNQQMQGRDNHSFIEQTLSQNTWMFEADATGQPITRPTFNQNTGQWEHQRVLSQWGHRAADYVREAQRMGMSNARDQWNYAYRLIQGDSAAFQLQQQAKAAAPNAPPPLSPREASNDKFLADANKQPPARGNSVPAPAPKNGKMPRFADLMNEVMAGNG